MTNADELKVAEYLLDRVAEQMTDRNGARHAIGWDPRQNVVTGVLEPTYIRPAKPAKGGEAGDSDEEEPNAKPVLALPQGEPPTMGLDFVMSLLGEGDRLPIEVDVDLALYVEEYPSRSELLTHLHLDPKGVPLPAPEAPPSEADEAEASTDATTSAVAMTAAPQESPDFVVVDAAVRNKPRSLTGVWRRLNVGAHGLQVSVPLDGSDSDSPPELTEQVRIAIDGAFASPRIARRFTGRRELPASALGDDVTYQAEIKAKEDRDFQVDYPTLRLSAFAEQMPGGHWRVSLSLQNATQLPVRPFQNLAVYDCRLKVRPLAGRIEPQRFHLAPDDYRYEELSLVHGHGRGTVAVFEASTQVLHSECLPRFFQAAIRPRESHVARPRWSDLSHDPDPILDSVEAAMGDYLEEWDAFLGIADSAVARASLVERNQFQSEVERFRLGRRAMKEDPRLLTSFKLANEAMARVNANRDYDSWRLFQLVFILIHLPALAAREHPDPAFRGELDHADVLWFPTGGGKTEAYLGLILAALFYDRLRGKAHGITAWLKFPLRMLSVQQLARVLRVLIVAEELRLEVLGGEGDPFALGYLVGGGNTPNSLVWPSRDGWWPGIVAAEQAYKKDPKEYSRRRLINNCPFCGSKNSIALVPDAKRVRLLHRCTKCERELPLYASDEEIYRYLPAIMVGTVDKLSGFAYYGEFTEFSLGPRFRCEDHGWYSFVNSGKCLVGELCQRKGRQHEPIWKDPVPSLIVQDELHLVREELGAFDAHYEGLLAELQRGSPASLPSKILAASATIEQYEDQVRQVYGRRPRSFPCPGFARDRSFYVEDTPDVRRVYLGVLPHYRRKADVAGIVQLQLIQLVSELEADPDSAKTALDVDHLSTDQVRAMLFAYEVSLAYVNNKSHGDLIGEEIDRLSHRLASTGFDSITKQVLTGEVTVPELADAIDRIEEDTLAVPAGKRLRALVGTSVVSHGVDLERLNVMAMAGLPTTVADYIQASSRSGRAHVGIVVTVFDTFQRRERSAFTNFLSFHRFLDRMVEPVPVNKYAYFAVRRTLPGVAMALLWDLCRRPEYIGPENGIRRTRDFTRWWNARSSELKAEVARRIDRAYRSAVDGVNEQQLEDELALRAGDRWLNQEVPSLGAPMVDATVELFTSKPLASFRDIDIAVLFEALPNARNAIEALGGGGSE